MLYHLFDFLEEQYQLTGASLFRYITFRAISALLLSLLISMVFGGRIIRLLRRMQIGESVRDLGLEGQKQKEGTPTMGGIIIIMSILFPCLLFARLDNVYVLLMILATSWMGIIGFIDDYIKIFRKNKDGLKAKFKVIGQVGLGIIVAFTFLVNQGISVKLRKSDN
jgi:phospho-N-acetylmuramoyl-pentapeptide-transferase